MFYIPSQRNPVHAFPPYGGPFQPLAKTVQIEYFEVLSYYFLDGMRERPEIPMSWVLSEPGIPENETRDVTKTPQRSVAWTTLLMATHSIETMFTKVVQKNCR